jgi:hypothetical protein
VYLLLTRTCGWHAAEYERWFADAAAALLLERDASTKLS